MENSLNNKLLTIIIPAYNMEEYLDKCCESLIIDNDNDELDVIIINDGSTDRTSAIAHSYQENYCNIFRVIDKENGNYGSCINIGLAEAKGYFTKILDADDTFNNIMLESYLIYLKYIKLDAINNNNIIDLIITDTDVVDLNGNILRKKECTFISEKYYDLDITQIKIFSNITQHCVTYRTELLRDMNYKQTEGISYSDQEWVILPFLAINKFVYHPITIYIYTMGRDGQTAEPNTYISNQWMQIILKKDMLTFIHNNKVLYQNNNLKFIDKMICSYINKIYMRFLMLYKNRLNEDELIEFDKYLNDNYKHIYNMLGNMKFSTKLPVKYIKYWRNKKEKWKYNLIYKIYTIYNRVKIII